jgi:ATP-dependent RNA helicase SUPV3L1/SUV3
MLRFPMSKSSKPETTAAPAAKTNTKSAEAHPLDALTGGAFSAPTSGERAARIRTWLGTEPTAEQMADVYKDLANRDKGAAKPLKEKLDELKRSKGQEAVAAEWAEKAQALLATAKLNLADALAWQRDAAKAGAPLSKEPLAGFKAQLAERVKTIEDLQHRTQVQREAAVLLAQRTEVLSLKPWRDAEAALESLLADVTHWQTQADEIAQDANWASVDPKFPTLLDASRAQLLAVWDAFQSAIAVAVKAADDTAAPLPAVPVWADELRVARGVAPVASAGETGRAPKTRLDPAALKEMREKSSAIVQEAVAKLEREVGEGHGKATPKVAADLRQALKENIRNIDSKLEAAAHAALTSAGELEGWQRWRADQIREELVVKAEALVAKPMGGRKQQEALRHMREQWKTSDQGGTPNHALWKRFDDACNEAHKVVEVWLETVKEQTEATKAQRKTLIDEVLAWAEANKGNTDWKMHIRSLNGFVEKWREAGHLSEKAFAEIQPQWKAAMETADAALTAARTDSLARRKAMIEEATVLGAEPMLRIDAVKSLQQRWQHEAQGVPIERKQEQKLWDAFRKPIDDAFQRKTAEREKAASALGEYDRMVLEASKAVAAATASGDAQQIHAAAKALEAIVAGKVPVPAPAAAVAAPAQAAPAVADASPSVEAVLAAGDAPADAPAEESAKPVLEAAADAAAEDFAEAGQPANPDPVAAEPAPAPKAPPKPIVAMRGDDRPGARRPEAAPAGRGGKFGDRKDSRGPGGKPGGPRQSTDNKFEPYRADREERGPRPDRNARPAFEERGPRLGDAAFRAQREAFEAANMALKKLAMQAHGEVLTNLLTAWEKRDPEQLPSAQDLGKVVTPAVRSSWVKAVSTPSGKDASEALLRMEIAAELPTPAEHISARRMLQLQLLTKRNAPAPLDTWGEDAAQVLAGDFDAGKARRVQNALKALLKR